MSSAASKTIMSHMGTLRRLVGEIAMNDRQKELFLTVIKDVEFTTFMTDIQKEEKRCAKDLTCLLGEAMSAIAGVVTEVFSEGEAVPEYQASLTPLPPPPPPLTNYTPYQGELPTVPQVEQLPVSPPTPVLKKRKKVVRKRKLAAPQEEAEASATASVMPNMADELEKYMAAIDSVIM